MKKTFLVFAGAAGIFLFACLVAPTEPNNGTSENGLSCGTNQRAFNGSCKQVCQKTADCPASTSCMKVSGDVALCLEYKHCAYLGSDTECSKVGGGYGFTTYGKKIYDPYPGPGGCAGDAKWQVIAPSGDPQCGVAHAVTRCAPVGGGCGLVSGSTADIADP